MVTWVILGVILLAAFCAVRYAVRKAKNGRVRRLLRLQGPFRLPLRTHGAVRPGRALKR